MMTEGREANPDQVTPHVVHPGLHQDYNLDFQMWRVDDIAPTLTPSMLAGLANSVHLTGWPVVPKGPASLKMEEGLRGLGGAPAQPDLLGPSCVDGPMETEGDKPLDLEAIDLDATMPALTSEDAAAIIISDDEVTIFPGGWPIAISTPKIEVTWGHKQPSGDRSPPASPVKRRATEEMEESPPPYETALLKGMLEEDILHRRYVVYSSDYAWVQSVHGSLLGLEADTTPSREDIDKSCHFTPWMAASQQDHLDVIAKHWVPPLRREGLLVECPPNEFTAPVDWIPLYTHEGLEKYFPTALSALSSPGAPSLIAVVPPEF